MEDVVVENDHHHHLRSSNEALDCSSDDDKINSIHHYENRERLEGCLGELIVVGESTDGVVSIKKNLRGKKIKQVCASAHSNHIAVLTDAQDITWLSEQPLQEDIKTALGDVKLQHIDFGANHAIGLTLDGHLYAWGDGNEGQLGISSRITKSVVPQRVHRDNCVFTDVATGSSHNIAMTATGGVYTWGRGFDGQTASGSVTKSTEQNECLYSFQPVPKAVGVLLTKPVKSISCGENFTAVVTRNGQVWSFGEARAGQLGIGKATKHMTPVQTILEDSITSVACGSAHTIALTSSGSLISWGLNIHGQLGVGDTTSRFTPENVVTPTKFLKISCGKNFSAGIEQDTGRVFTWGCSTSGQLGHGKHGRSGVNVLEPTKVEAVEHLYVTSATCAANDLILFAPAWITSMDPVSGPTSGGTLLTLTASSVWESEDLTVRFAPIGDSQRLPRAALATLQDDNRTIVVKTPKFALPGPVFVEVAANGKHFTSNEWCFEVYSPVEVLEVSTKEICVSKPSEEILLRVKGDNSSIKTSPTLRIVPSKLSGIEPFKILNGKVQTIEGSDDDESPVSQITFEVPMPKDFDKMFKARIELSLNAVDFETVKVFDTLTSNVPALITFHDATLKSVLPNSRVMLSSGDCKSTDVKLLGSDFYDIGESVINLVIMSDDSTILASAIASIKSFSADCIVITIPALCDWNYNDPDHISDDEEQDEQQKLWWKEFDYLKCSIDVSLSKKSSVKHLTEPFFHFISAPKITNVSPNLGPVTGNTKVRVELEKDLPFVTSSASFQVVYRETKTEESYEDCTYASILIDETGCKAITGLTPLLDRAGIDERFKKEEVEEEEEEEEETPEPVVEKAWLKASLNSGIDYTKNGVEFQYYDVPEITGIEPNQVLLTKDSTVKIRGKSFINTGLIKVEMRRQEDDDKILVLEGAFEEEDCIEFTIVAEDESILSGTYSVSVSLNGQQFENIIRNDDDENLKLNQLKIERPASDENDDTA